MNNQGKYNNYRKYFDALVYESYNYDVQSDGLHIAFCFRLTEKRCFRPTAFIPARPFLNMDQPKEVMDRLVFNIGMVELVSYWKTVCPPVVRIECGALDERQQAFWKKLYWNGLGEFYYTNGIKETEEDFLRFEVAESASPVPLSTPSIQHSPLTTTLVPVGGGKDSVVTLEALKELGIRPLIMNPRGATLECAKKAGFERDEVLEIRRSLDPLMLELNAKGCLNGHTPFSAMLAFYTLLAAQLSGVPNIALSNEDSANESTVSGSYVNHQYSKSLEFENDFRAYVKDYCGDGYNYFSFLRPISELQIAMLFAKEEKYFDVFKSCNVGSKQDIWCGHCAKCLFAYIILSPFIAPERLDAIFGKNMLDEVALRLEFEQLTGHTESKPFECVGTVSEVNSALSMTISNWYGDRKLPALLKSYQPETPVTQMDRISDQHNLTDRYLEILKSKF